MTEKITYSLNLLAAFSILMMLSLVWKDRKSIRGVWSIITFSICIFLYLTISYAKNTSAYYILLLGPMLAPFSFWLFTRSLFTDYEIPKKRLILFFVLTAFTYYTLYVLIEFGYIKYPSLISRLVSIFFVLLALYESQNGQSTDLDLSRLKLRKVFIYIVGGIVIITLLGEIGLQKQDQKYLWMVQRFIILILVSAFVYFNFSIRSKMLSKPKKPSNAQFPELIDKIQQTITSNQLHHQEKLTIGQLAESIEEQEYKVRKAINQDMGYRNFLDFVNSYRIKEATGYLKDPTMSQMTVLEIAFQTGFNSIGPFNRAFKQTTGYTPTDFRKKHL